MVRKAEKDNRLATPSPPDPVAGMPRVVVRESAIEFVPVMGDGQAGGAVTLRRAEVEITPRRAADSPSIGLAHLDLAVSRQAFDTVVRRCSLIAARIVRDRRAELKAKIPFVVSFLVAPAIDAVADDRAVIHVELLEGAIEIAVSAASFALQATVEVGRLDDGRIRLRIAALDPGGLVKLAGLFGSPKDRGLKLLRARLAALSLPPGAIDWIAPDTMAIDLGRMATGFSLPLALPDSVRRLRVAPDGIDVEIGGQTGLGAARGA